MTIDEIKELIRVVEETGIAELEIQRGEDRVRITRSKTGNQELMLPAVVPISAVPAQPQPQNINPAPLHAAEPGAPTPAADDRSTPVTSPIVGTYYDAPSPDAPPFVKVGDTVHPKQVLCIIESMKLMNEIEAEVAGTIVAKLVENGRPVEYGEALFTIRPL